MLTGQGIKDAVSSGKIEITYSCLPDNNCNYIQLPSEINPLSNQDAANHFDNCVGENRIKLSIGFLVKSIYKSHIGSPFQYYNFNAHDLRKSSYTIDPLESVIVYTNEWIHLKDGYAGIIIQRVSHYFRGLSIAPSYIATGWEGILLAQITNNSAIPQTISLGDDIARLFIFETNGAGDVLPSTSIHYRRKWHPYLNQRRNPFEEFGDIQTPGARDDVISLLMVSAFKNSLILKDEFKKILIENQSQAILSSIQNDPVLKNELKNIFHDTTPSTISKVKCFLNQKKHLGIPIKILIFTIIFLFFIFQSFLTISFYTNFREKITDPKETLSLFLDFASFGGRLKQAEDKIDGINSSMPKYGTYQIDINNLQHSKGNERALEIEQGKRESLWVISKSPECGEIINYSKRKTEKEYTINFTSNGNKILNSKCTINWVLVDDKS